MQSTRYSCQISMKHDFSKQILEKYSNTEFHENPSGGSRVIPCERTARISAVTKAVIRQKKKFICKNIILDKQLSR
jgi:hypothetical protein